MGTSTPIVAIVGRPNVGKSTLFNRLVGKRQTVTADTAGTTRDRIFGVAEWQGKTISIVDTGGFSDARSTVDSGINRQVEHAVSESDLVLLVTSGPDGVVSGDRAIAELVRKRGKNVIVVVNKLDDAKVKHAESAFHALGIEPVVGVSALHGRGTGDLAEIIMKAVRPAQRTARANRPTFTIVGRPNAGKSTLVNRLLGTEAVVTDVEPHTTRDPSEWDLTIDERPWRLIDTAGQDRRTGRRSGVSYWSLLRTFRAMQESDVAVLLVDGAEGPTVQDARIAAQAMESGCGLVVAVNKWDLVEKTPDIQERFFNRLRERLPFLPSPPVVFISAQTGEKLDRLLRAVADVYKVSDTKLSTPELNRLVQSDLSEYAGGKRKARLFYVTQSGTRPPTFVCFVNQPDLWKDDLRRHLASVLREGFGLFGASLQLDFRKRTREKVA